MFLRNIFEQSIFERSNQVWTIPVARNNFPTQRFGISALKTVFSPDLDRNLYQFRKFYRFRNFCLSWKSLLSIDNNRSTQKWTFSLKNICFTQKKFFTHKWKFVAFFVKIFCFLSWKCLIPQKDISPTNENFLPFFWKFSALFVKIFCFLLLKCLLSQKNFSPTNENFLPFLWNFSVFFRENVYFHKKTFHPQMKIFCLFCENFLLSFV